MTGGSVFAIGQCICCGVPFSFNPVRVPSSSAITGTREPVCEGCFERINVRRREMGLEPFIALPGAWDACDEGELS